MRLLVLASPGLVFARQQAKLFTALPFAANEFCSGTSPSSFQQEGETVFHVSCSLPKRHHSIRVRLR
jgi:hypothetical protein